MYCTVVCGVVWFWTIIKELVSIRPTLMSQANDTVIRLTQAIQLHKCIQPMAHLTDYTIGASLISDTL